MATTAILPITFPMTRISALCRRYRVRELSLFGSVLRADFRPDSDVDMLVLFEPEARIGLMAFGALGRELSEAVGRRVDLVSKRGLNPAIRQDVLDSARVIYGAE